MNELGWSMTLDEWKKRCRSRTEVIKGCMEEFEGHNISEDARAIAGGSLLGGSFVAEAIELALVGKEEKQQ